MAELKRHLRRRHRDSPTVAAACGLVDPKYSTPDPAKVTCGACRRTLACADAEARAVMKNSRQWRRNRKA